MKASFSDDPGLLDDLFDLLDVVFPGIRSAAAHAGTLGAHWEAVSTPFVLSEGRRIVSHIGVIGLPLVVARRRVDVGSLHAVATHPEHRRRGHFRGLMEEVLRDCERRFETLVLTTENPEYYEPFDFRLVPEHRFTVRCRSVGRAGAMRLLDTRDPQDVALLRRLLETRAPVSEVVGVVGEFVAFCFNEGRNPLWYAEDLDVVVCAEREERRLVLFDVVGPEIPPLAALVERIPSPLDEIVVCFAPDRLGVEATAIPHVLDHDGPSHLMVRGAFAAESEAFTLPRPART